MTSEVLSINSPQPCHSFICQSRPHVRIRRDDFTSRRKVPSWIVTHSQPPARTYKMAAPPGLRPFAEQCLEKLPRAKFQDRSIWMRAKTLRQAMIDRRQIPSLFQKSPHLDKAKAYEISAACCALAMSHNRVPVGRKIGFTNTKIWGEYNVSEPNFGYMYKHRVQTLANIDKTMWFGPLDMNLEPRIEPEIVFCLKEKPISNMTEREVLACVEWIAHGFEIVVSLFKDWKFTAIDTTAQNALHQRLCIGTKRYIQEGDLDILPAQLADFEIKLYRNNELADTGRGSNVLGSPIKALLHLCAMLEKQDLHPQLCPGEIITTGTLTKAIPISLNDTWSTKLDGIDLRGLDLKIEPLPSQAVGGQTVKKSGFRRVYVDPQRQSSDSDPSF